MDITRRHLVITMVSGEWNAAGIMTHQAETDANDLIVSKAHSRPTVMSILVLMLSAIFVHVMLIECHSETKSR